MELTLNKIPIWHGLARHLQRQNSVKITKHTPAWTYRVITPPHFRKTFFARQYTVSFALCWFIPTAYNGEKILPFFKYVRFVSATSLTYIPNIRVDIDIDIDVDPKWLTYAHCLVYCFLIHLLSKFTDISSNPHINQGKQNTLRH